MSTNKIVSSITSDNTTQQLLKKHGLNASKVTWEDTARNKGSCWGPNISDMTLELSSGNTMPVIRKPNYSDVTVDIPLSSFTVIVGNESGSELKSVPLEEYLKNIKLYTDNTHDIDLLRYDKEGKETKTETKTEKDTRTENDQTVTTTTVTTVTTETTSNNRTMTDTDVLTSTQCCVLPCDKEGNVDFNVRLYNYQSRDGDPAVLVIMVSNLGTSAQIVGSSTQAIYFNDNGTAKNFNVERLQFDRKKKTGVEQEKVKSFKEMEHEEHLSNALMLIQVPLKQKPPVTRSFNQTGGDYFNGGCDSDYELEACVCFGSDMCGDAGGGSRAIHKKINKTSVGMDMGVISTGVDQGEFTGTQDQELERDYRFPIRCTMQYYRVTDEDNINEHDATDIKEQLETLYNVSDAKGSLVFDISNRTTESKTVTTYESTDAAW
jgi:hypothetical protein